jgi:hypothetical protein
VFERGSEGVSLLGVTIMLMGVTDANRYHGE